MPGLCPHTGRPGHAAAGTGDRRCRSKPAANDSGHDAGHAQRTPRSSRCQPVSAGSAGGAADVLAAGDADVLAAGRAHDEPGHAAAHPEHADAAVAGAVGANAIDANAAARTDGAHAAATANGSVAEHDGAAGAAGPAGHAAAARADGHEAAAARADGHDAAAARADARAAAAAGADGHGAAAARADGHAAAAAGADGHDAAAARADGHAADAGGLLGRATLPPGHDAGDGPCRGCASDVAVGASARPLGEQGHCLRDRQVLPLRHPPRRPQRGLPTGATDESTGRDGVDESEVAVDRPVWCVATCSHPVSQPRPGFTGHATQCARGWSELRHAPLAALPRQEQPG
mmetsp:Transcript_46447/g.145596  ORF Transcript_46447/g.145596 Transcript_46447/m.145596 type:complete len:346 (-) Transcript_46447:112-1149(-)